MSQLNGNSLTECAVATRRAGRRLASTSIEERNAMLEAIRKNLISRKEQLLAANRTDMEAAQKDVASGKLSPTLYKRLDLSGSKWNSLIAGLETVVALKDPLGRVTYSHEMTEDGLRLYRLTCPIGVVLVIFEARPEAAVQIASLCIKSGNALLLKGGSEARHSNEAIVGAIREAIEPMGMADAIQFVDSRSAVDELLKMDEYIDVVVPRGSNSLVKYIKSHTSIPVLGHADGICHTYIQSKADLDMAIKVTVDAKTQYPAVCNATETILVDETIADSFVPRLFSSLREKGVTVHGDAAVLKILGGAQDGLVEASGNDFDTEWCSLECSMHVVPDLDAAVEHINVHGSHHTDCIITADSKAADEFMRKVDSAGVYWNASTRFADGFRYGFGAEVGVSTNRIHARGPMGLEGLTICKYRLYGNGHTVTEYGDKLLPPSEEALPGEDETELREMYHQN
ncbi:gpantothenate kinase 4, putative [Perkinsus marinus ATCC 50983]|uniref:glutamate-5-semialdehyde dehydrogenase n=1 Tax=Perkinsus marinus (strain ATCC 50983 / TXsc) TaxID=423536 RepID=C5KB52_PERM5|nr:gpantothenate kinase 4,  putative [Perkinsus marinus ATCC 50983]EER18378.1 gpantothenate kinase 4, putative [Perkinsus marinus ATCC 50983]|eukprot:XP_002786582.1 gpantothenate kinase 4,  putative [Perkinsus marinus ATCC 50983]